MEPLGTLLRVEKVLMAVWLNVVHYEASRARLIVSFEGRPDYHDKDTQLR